MTVQQSKRRPLSRYLKDFKHSQTHCAHCKNYSTASRWSVAVKS